MSRGCMVKRRAEDTSSGAAVAHAGGNGRAADTGLTACRSCRSFLVHCGTRLARLRRNCHSTVAADRSSRPGRRTRVPEVPMPDMKLLARAMTDVVPAIVEQLLAAKSPRVHREAMSLLERPLLVHALAMTGGNSCGPRACWESTGTPCASDVATCAC